MPPRSSSQLDQRELYSSDFFTALRWPLPFRGPVAARSMAGLGMSRLGVEVTSLISSVSNCGIELSPPRLYTFCARPVLLFSTTVILRKPVDADGWLCTITRGGW